MQYIDLPPLYCEVDLCCPPLPICLNLNLNLKFNVKGPLLWYYMTWKWKYMLNELNHTSM